MQEGGGHQRETDSLLLKEREKREKRPPFSKFLEGDSHSYYDGKKKKNG